MDSSLVQIALAIVSAATPLLLAASGELIVEKSGTLNLGLEGMMLVGAVAGFAVTLASGSHAAGLLAAALAGTAMALAFAALALGFRANQVASGLALAIFGAGISALAGAGLVGRPLPPLPRLDLPGLSGLPIIGPLLFGQDVLVYLSLLAPCGAHWFLHRTHAGLVLRAVGDSHDAAHAIGYPVVAIRYAACAFGGAMSGLAGAYLSLAYTPLWAEDMTAGRGWIALALVVFSGWRPGRLLLGAYLFGALAILQVHVQTLGLGIPAQIVAMLPYLATVMALALISRDGSRIRLQAPAALGRTFHAAGQAD